MDYVISCLGRDSVPSNPFYNRIMKGTGMLKDNSRASIRIVEPRESWKMEKRPMVSDRHVPERGLNRKQYNQLTTVLFREGTTFAVCWCP